METQVPFLQLGDLFDSSEFISLCQQDTTTLQPLDEIVSEDPSITHKPSAIHSAMKRMDESLVLTILQTREESLARINSFANSCSQYFNQLLRNYMKTILSHLELKQ